MPRAPWWGVFFERIVRCTKLSVKNTLGRARLTYEELLTVLIEVECVLNSRPLTYLYDDEIEEPLTPFHLMIGRRLLSNNMKAGKEETQPEDSATDVNKIAKYLKLLQDHFWNRWQKEDVTELRQFHRYASGCKEPAVLVKEDKRPRNTWKLGRVKEMINGSDDKARGAIVSVAGSKKSLADLKRSIEHLVPVECNQIPETVLPADENETCADSETGPTPEVAKVLSNRRGPRRRAAIMSDIKRQTYY